MKLHTEFVGFASWANVERAWLGKILRSWYWLCGGVFFFLLQSPVQFCVSSNTLWFALRQHMARWIVRGESPTNVAHDP